MNTGLNRAGNLLLLLLGVLPQIYLLSDTLHCAVDERMPLWIVLLCCCLWYAASYQKGLLIGMPLSALLLFAVYKSYDANPTAQLVDFFDRISGVYYEHFYAPGSSYFFTDSVPSHALLLIFLAFLLAAYLASALTTRAWRIPISLLGTLPVVLSCLAVNGNPPPLVILPFLLFVILLLASGNSYSEQSVHGTVLFSALLPVTILLCALLLVYDPARYHADEEDYARSRRFDLISSWLSDRFGQEQSGTEIYLPGSVMDESQRLDDGETLPMPKTGWGELGTVMDMRQEFDLSVLGETAFRAKADVLGPLYLRAISYEDYTGTGWRVTRDAAANSSLPFTAYAAAASSDARSRSLQLESEEALPFYYLPYYSTLSGWSDLAVPGSNLRSYSIDYSSTSAVSTLRLPAEVEALEQAYRDYAHSVYTELPEDTKAILLELCRSAGIDASSPDLIQRVASYVQSAAEYDIMTEPYPADDYAVYFLTSAESGYCVHFATAAAALYRALGVPARVTVGYLFDAQPARFVEVSEADAHAWVEIYQDGLGWIPIEVTGQSGVGDSPGEDGEETEAETTASAGTEAEAPGDMQGSSAQSGGPETLPVGIIEPQTQSDTGLAAGQRSISWRTICLVLLLLLLLASPLLWYRYARRRFLRSIYRRDRRRAAVAIYRAAAYAVRLGAKMPDAIETCAEKASFSRHEISEAEIQSGIMLLTAQIEELYPRLKPFQKFRLKVWKGLL